MKKTAIILTSAICFIIFSCKKNNDDSFKDNAPLSEPLMISISNELANDKLFLEFYTNIQME